MPICLWSQPSCHVSLKFAGYSNLLNEDVLKMSNLKLSQPGVSDFLRFVNPITVSLYLANS